MNYFAHGFRFVERPYFMAGTAVPDWLNVANRKAKARARAATEWLQDDDSRMVEIAQGIIQHHHDDGWFHGSRAFVELSMEFAVEIRELLGGDRGFRAGFLGHVLVELLLDSSLIEDDRDRLDQYYDAFKEIDFEWVSMAVNRITTRPVPNLAQLIPRFCSEGFLYDYLDDARLLWRLNHVMRRVKLIALPETIVDFFPSARHRVREQQAGLLTEPRTDQEH